MDRRLMLAAALATPAACAPPAQGGGEPAPAPPPVAAARVPAEGQWVNGTWEADGGLRYYRLYLPAGYDPTRPRMLVVLLHGCTQDPNDLARGTRIAAHADENDFIALLPEQPTGANPHKCWNWYEPAHQGPNAGEPALIAGMTEQVSRTYPIDPAHLHIAGISAGAAMAQNVVVAYPRMWASAALHSGIPWKAAEDVTAALGVMQRGSRDVDGLGERAAGTIGRGSPPVPVLVIHGKSDTVVHPANGTQTARLWTVLNARLWAGYRPEGRLTTTETSGVDGGYRWTRSVYGSEVGSLVEELVVTELGHAWSGGSTRGSYTDERGPDATAEMIRFFRAHPRQRAR